MIHWQPNGYSLAVLLTALASGVVAVYAWRRRPAVGAGLVALMMLAVAEWSLAYALELAATDLAAKIFWARVEYLGITAVPVLWLCFVLQYTGRNKWLTRRNLALLATVPILTGLLIWTNQAHGLIWRQVGLENSGPYPLLAVRYGAWFWVHSAYCYALLLLGPVLLIRSFIRSPAVYRGQVKAMLLAVFVPWLGNVVYITGLSPFPSLDLTPFAFTISGVVVAWALFRFQLLDITPMGYDTIVENMTDGIIVLDTQGRIVRINPAACRNLGCMAETVIGQPAGRVFARWPELATRHQQAAEAEAQICLEEGGTQRYFDLHISVLHNRRGRPCGQMIVLHEATALKQAEMAQREFSRKLEDQGQALAKLLELSFTLTTTYEVERVLETAIAAAVEIVTDAERGTLQWLGEEDGETLHTVVFSYTNHVPDRVDTFRWGEGIAGHALSSQQLINVPDVLEDERFIAGERAPQFRSLLVAPLVAQGRALGTLSLTSKRVGAFTATDETLARLAAGQAAAALQNAHEFTARRLSEEALHRYAKRIQIMHEIDQAILAARLPETIALAAVGRIRQLIPAQRATVLARDEDGEIKMLAAQSVVEMEQMPEAGLYRTLFEEQTLKSGMVHGIPDLARVRQRSPLQQALYQAGVRAYVAVPLYLPNQKELIGTLNLESVSTNAFVADHIDISTEVAAMLAVAIRQVRLFELAQREIAERQQAEKALRQHAAVLEAQNAELDAFAHTVAHDLKNPLTAITGYSSLLKNRGATMPDEQRQNFLRILERTSYKMRNIIEELLLLASVRGMERVEMEPLDMGAIVTEAQGRLAYLLEEHQAEIRLPDHWPVALGHGPWVEEVWANYLSNAIKYGGRPLQIEMGFTIQDSGLPAELAGPAQSGPLYPEDGLIHFWVRDNGPGLSAEEQGRLFTPFERLHQMRAEGHGLGLSIVQRIMEKLGGRVGVDSQPGQGSLFYFSLPAADEGP